MRFKAHNLYVPSMDATIHSGHSIRIMILASQFWFDSILRRVLTKFE